MKIKFVPQNIEVELDSEKSVLDIAQENGIKIQSSCNGTCQCGDCRISIKDGENNTLPPNSQEFHLIGKGYYLDQRRLACQVYAFGGMTIDVSEQNERIQNNKISKQFLERTKKKSVDETHSVGDILIEDDADIKALKQNKNSSEK